MRETLKQGKSIRLIGGSVFRCFAPVRLVLEQPDVRLRCKVRFTTAAALVHELIEAADDRRLQRLQKGLAAHDMLIIDERGSIIFTSNLPFDEWTEVFGSERLTSAILGQCPDEKTEHEGNRWRAKWLRTKKAYLRNVSPMDRQYCVSIFAQSGIETGFDLQPEAFCRSSINAE